MKIKILIWMILNFGLFALAQDNDNSGYYKLYKDGEKIPRPIVHLLFNNCSNGTNKSSNGNIVFNIEGQVFKYSFKKHKRNELTLYEFEKIDFNEVKELFNLEYEEYSKRAIEIKNTEGFTPAPPIDHFILNIYIVCKIKNGFIRYETDWVYTKF